MDVINITEGARVLFLLLCLKLTMEVPKGADALLRVADSTSETAVGLPPSLYAIYTPHVCGENDTKRESVVADCL